MTSATIPLYQRHLLNELRRLSKYGRFKPPHNLTEFILLLLKICQLGMSFQVGNDLIAVSSKQLFIFALCLLILLSIFINGLSFYVWQQHHVKLSAIVDKLLMGLVATNYIFIVLGMILYLMIEGIRETIGLPQVIFTILQLDMINVVFIGYSIPTVLPRDINRSTLYISLLGVLLGLLK